jgi:hypothetical protein
MSINITFAVSQVGLVYKGNEEQIPLSASFQPQICLGRSLLLVSSAYELYADEKSEEYYLPQQKTWLQWLHLRRGPAKPTPDKAVNMAEKFKTTFSREHVCVHFVGVW